MPDIKNEFSKTGFDDLMKNDTPDEATKKLRAAAKLIVQDQDFSKRLEYTNNLVTAMDTSAVLKILEEVGPDRKLIELPLRNFLHRSVAEALSHFRPSMSTLESAQARSAAGENSFDDVAAYYRERYQLIVPDIAEQRVRNWIKTIDVNQEKFGQALYELFQGKTEAWKNLQNEEAKELFVIITFGAHARWAAGQIERSRNETPKPGEVEYPLDRKIFGDLRRIKEAMTSDREAVDMILRDWREFMKNLLQTERMMAERE